ncbi:MAG: DUF4394 domain-containing protein [Armatimonadetes bacterium]|nr:DUF4394 domain-containing protein [Armatimonadota bacterium]
MNKLTFVFVLAAGVSLAARAERIYGISESNQLVSFNSSAPGTLLSNVMVSGLMSGEHIVGIDFRPNGNGLYGLGSSNRVYILNAGTGAATAVGAGFSSVLTGTSYGFDFNPTVDRIRVTSDSDQNLRLNPITGTTAATDTNLNYAAADPNFGANPNIVGSAYTNSRAGATTTTLYGIDSTTNTLVLQNPPNSGTLNTIGSLGVDTNEWVGFDISGSTGVAFASLTTPGANVHSSNLFTMNLTTGAAQFVGTIGGESCDRLVGLTVVPEPSSVLALMGGLGVMAMRRRRGA